MHFFLFIISLCIIGFTILGVALGIGGEAFLRSNARRVEAMEKAARLKFMKVLKKKNDDHVVEDDNNNVDVLSDQNDSNNIHNNTTHNVIHRLQQPKHVPPIFKDIKSVMLRELPIVVALLIIACIMMQTEGWTISSSIYWTIISATTIGFGDITPDSTITKIGCIIFLPLVVAVMGEFLTHIAGVYLNRQNHNSEMEFMSRCLTMQDLKNMDLTHDGRVSEHEFLVCMLMTLHKVKMEDIQEIEDLFRKLDTDGNGYLEPRDLWLRHQRLLCPIPEPEYFNKAQRSMTEP